jgi:hypothetical protein
MNEQETTLAAYKEYLSECANNDSLDYSSINAKYEFKGVNDEYWIPIQESTYIISLYSKHIFQLKKLTVVVNGKTVPAPMDREPKENERFYYLESGEESAAAQGTFESGCGWCERVLRARWFDNMQDASEYFKALLGIK